MYSITAVSVIIYFSFATAAKAIGAEGFKAVWTEIVEGKLINSCLLLITLIL